MQYIQAFFLTKQNFFWCIDAGLEHMAARSPGNGTNFDWLRKSCDISTCDLSPDGNPENYGRPMKLAIDQEIPDLYTSFVVTRVVVKKAKQTHGMQDIDLTDTLIDQSFNGDISNSLFSQPA